MIINALPTAADLRVPISLVFWMNIAVYVLHVLEESTLGEVFVEKLRKNVWPDYSWKHFFGFNTVLMSLNLLAIIIYEIIGGGWLILPLALTLERCLNGCWHLGETIATRKFSSGLLSSILSWILVYFLIRYSLLKGEISALMFIASAFIGAVITGSLMGSMLAFRRKYVTNRSMSPKGKPASRRKAHAKT
jgi:hypothetical protein